MSRLTLEVFAFLQGGYSGGGGGGGHGGGGGDGSNDGGDRYYFMINSACPEGFMVPFAQSANVSPSHHVSVER